jgi:hypothetical protein
LDFVGFSRRWGGAIATIEPESNGHMWGAVWQMENANIESLDRYLKKKNRIILRGESKSANNFIDRLIQ